MLDWTEKDTFLVDLHWYYLSIFMPEWKKKALYCLTLLGVRYKKENLISLSVLTVKSWRENHNLIVLEWSGSWFCSKKKKKFLVLKDYSAKRFSCSFVLRSSTMKFCNTSYLPNPLEIKTKGILHISLVFRPYRMVSIT